MSDLGPRSVGLGAILAHHVAYADNAAMTERPENPPRYTFPPSRRLSRRRDFSAVFEEGARRRAGPLLLLARPNGLGHPRLGLTVPRRVGKAVRRNRIKRLLREAFRLHQHELPLGMDYVVLVRPHRPKPLSWYERMLRETANGLARDLARRSNATDAGDRSAE